MQQLHPMRRAAYVRVAIPLRRSINWVRDGPQQLAAGDFRGTSELQRSELASAVS
jgi:hypothetical protein